MKEAYIIGASGHGRVIASIIYRKYTDILFVDANKALTDVIYQGDFFDQIDQYRNSDIFIGIGSNRYRIEVYNKLIELGLTPANCIADNAFVAHDAEVGNGVVICPGSVVGSRAIIGNNTIVNTLSSVDHDCVLGNHSQVTAGVTFGGTTVVGENCFFGVKSATVPNINVGNNSVVMAGSLVYKDVPDNVMVGGTPARIMKQL